MAGFFLIPKDDPRQAHRLTRYFLAVLSSMLVLFFLAMVHVLV